MVSPYERGGARQPSTPLDTGWETQVKLLGQSFEDVLPVTAHDATTGRTSIVNHEWALPKASAGGLGADVPTHAHGFSTGAYIVDLTLLTNNTNASGTIAVNSSGVYIATAQDRFRWDGSFQPITHFRIYGFMQSSAAGETVSLQLAANGTPGTPLSAGGADLVVDNTNQEWDSGWIALAAEMTTDSLLVIGKSGSTATVDLSVRHLHIAFKWVP